MTLLYNGIQYEIEDEGEIEKINMSGDDEGGSDNNLVTETGLRESMWQPKIVHLFLDECIKRKTELRDPKVRRRKLFAEIRQCLKEKGYDFRIESLDRKLRNMKIHYIVSNRRYIKRRNWPYYEKMKILYPEEACPVKKRPPPHYSLESLGSLPFKSSYLSLLPSYKDSKPSGAPKSSHEEDQVSCSSFLDHAVDLNTLRMRILRLEERRTIAAEKILHELKESNRLKRESLELNIEMFKADSKLEDD